MDSIARGSLINLVTRVLAVALGLAITLYTARLGTSSQGAFALFTAVESVLLALLSGFGVAIARRISHHGERPAGLVGASVLASVLLGLAVAAGLALLSSVSGPAYQTLWLLALAAPVLFVSPNLAGVWLGRGRMAALARITLGAPVLTLAGIALAHLAGQPAALATVLWAWIGARWIVALAVLAAAARGGWIARPDGAALARETRFVLVIGLTNMVGLLNYKADLFLVEHFLGLSATGVYSIAVMAAELLWLVSSSVTTAAYARIGSPDAAEAGRVTVRAVHAGLLLLALLCPVLWIGAALVIPALLGSAYQPALPLLAVLLPGVAVFGAASALSAWFTNHAGRPWVPAGLASLSLAINVLVSVLAIPRLGMIGGALATSLSYTVAVGVGAVLFMRASGTPAFVLLRPDWRALAADIGRLRAAH
jgi:O-antigen/teichoic acid export membrane protein